jgi:hypothetical protein
MTRTNVMASSRPRTAGATRARLGSARTAGGLLSLVAVLLVIFALAVPGGALAAGESTSGYNQKPTTPTTGTSPSKEEKSTTPSSEEPAKSTSPTTTTPTTTTAKASTLPFTGFDLRWSLAIGLLLVGAGFSIVAVQRRERRGSR